MTKLLTTISGQFTKAFILGAFFPAAVFVILNTLLILPLFPSGLSPIKHLADFDKEWQAAIALFVAIVVSGLLYHLNIPLIRFYEGYLFEDSWLGRRMRERQTEKLNLINDEIKQLGDQYDGLMHKYENMDPDNDEYHKVEQRLTLLSSERRVRFPPEGFVIPTDLGNVIAAFEHYARLQYGMDSVVLWPRLVAKIDATYASVVDDAKTSLDFFINGSFLLAILALEYLFVGLWFRVQVSLVPGIVAVLITTAALAGLSWLAYQCSVDSAIGWGDHVKAAFDLYRWDLLDKLGYGIKPTGQDEVDLWQGISQGMLYGRPDNAPPPPYTKPALAATRVDARPPDIEWKWSITKGVEAAKSLTDATAFTVIDYVVTVKNELDKNANSATLFDTVPSGFDYIVGSAQLHRKGQAQNVEAVGTNPYRWELGAVDARQSVSLSYSVLLRPDVGKASS